MFGDLVTCDRHCAHASMHSCPQRGKQADRKGWQAREQADKHTHTRAHAHTVTHMHAHTFGRPLVATPVDTESAVRDHAHA
eukprot:14453854-Alexandrium_andersonii.AAC.1